MQSMTGYASGQGQGAGFSWTWELRSVNAKGLDIRPRIPDWIEGLDQKIRAQIGEVIKRGSVSLSLRLNRDGGEDHLSVNETVLDQVLDAIEQIEIRAMAKGVSIAPATAHDILSTKGVFDTTQAEADNSALRDALTADFAPVLAGFVDMRLSEGAAVQSVLAGQVDAIATLVDQAAGLLEQRSQHQKDHLQQALQRIMDVTDTADSDRIAQEMALIAVKTDVTEEIDRLQAHITAARDLIVADGPVGRKLDFLMQEFNREANTLCSKSQSKELTAIGLDLKVAIDQMREQVQNVE